MNYLFLYLAVLLVVLLLYLRRRQRVFERHEASLKQSIEEGLVEPASLHPVVDPTRCLGSGACVSACPEGAIGIVNGKAMLTNAASCIGHGACHAACPHDAISLVFGTATRGIDIPALSPSFESNVPGVFIAGELGGMGSIRKAAEQGRQAIESIRKRQIAGSFDYDVVIVGAGPAGLSAGLSAIERKLRYKLIEQEPSLGGSMFHYPRHKISMTEPVQLALVGKVRLAGARKERLLKVWQTIIKRTRLKITFNACMRGIERDGDGFVLRTDRKRYRTRNVLLALGRRGTPRKLGVPGEELPKVVYRLIDPGQYRGQSVLVVGGGDSALEAALALAQVPEVDVTLSYRGAAFNRVKPKIREALAAAKQAGQLRVIMVSNVRTIEPTHVVLDAPEGMHRLPNHAVIVCTGGQLPVALLQSMGIHFETKFGQA